jgi:hypothetical protein
MALLQSEEEPEEIKWSGKKPEEFKRLQEDPMEHKRPNERQERERMEDVLWLAMPAVALSRLAMPAMALLQSEEEPEEIKWSGKKPEEFKRLQEDPVEHKRPNERQERMEDVLWLAMPMPTVALRSMEEFRAHPFPYYYHPWTASSQQIFPLAFFMRMTLPF